MTRRLAAAGLVLLLAACGTSPRDALASRVDALTRQANAGDADGVRQAALALQDEVSAQRTAGDLAPERAQRLLQLAAQVRARADLVDAALQREQAAERDAAEQAARDAAAREAAETAARQAAAAAREQAAREQAAREQAAQDQAAREQAAREQAAREDDDGGQDGGEDKKGRKGKD